jgi:hypothetical protein
MTVREPRGRGEREIGQCGYCSYRWLGWRSGTNRYGRPVFMCFECREWIEETPRCSICGATQASMCPYGDDPCPSILERIGPARETAVPERRKREARK